MANSKQLKRNLGTALLALIIALVAVSSATFAWYIYNVNAHTTNVHMAAGAGVSLQIARTPSGPFGSSIELEKFTGALNPVSTNNFLNGFQKCVGYTSGAENQPMIVANLFGKSDRKDYYKTSLYFRTNGDKQNVYISNMSFKDDSASNPISTAIRVGFVSHFPGNNQGVNSKTMYIFEINDKKNPQREYNTATGKEGYVLDSRRTDGATVAFTPKTSKNYCRYDEATGTTTLNTVSLPLFEISGSAGGFGDIVQLDMYVWLEGCDPDCTGNLAKRTLKNLAVSFAAYDAASAAGAGS
ncbi:MAG: hypothetical protein IJS65_03190 [Clostridia bacterium]|nr:hypothetical protein [Clostridia bacterium]